MSDQVQEKRKRKQPPTFQHYAPEQAKKLKKAWIEKAKIKSKWAAEKRKLQASGIIPVTKKPWEVRDGKGAGKKRKKAAEDGAERDSDASDSSSHSKEPSKRHGDSEGEEEEASDAGIEAPPSKRTKHTDHSHGDLPPHLRKRGPDGTSSPKDTRHPRTEKPSHKSKSSWQEEFENSKHQTQRDLKGKSRAHPQDSAPANEDSERPVSLRDLKREAYDKKTLHNFRSDPLHKHAGRGRGRGGAGPPGRGGGRGEPPRGQPNMKLRMNFMLEKIKREYAS